MGKHKNLFIVTLIILIAATAFVMRVYGSRPQSDARRALEAGNQYLSEMKYKEAVTSFTEVLRIDPRNEAAMLGYGEAYVALADVQITIGFSDTLNEEDKNRYTDQLTSAISMIDEGIAQLQDLNGTESNIAYAQAMKTMQERQAEWKDEYERNLALVSRDEPEEEDFSELKRLAHELYDDEIGIHSTEVPGPVWSRAEYIERLSPFCEELKRHLEIDESTGKYMNKFMGLNDNYIYLANFYYQAHRASLMMGKLEDAALFYRLIWENETESQREGESFVSSGDTYIQTYSNGERRVYDRYGRRIEARNSEGTYVVTEEYGDSYWYIKRTELNHGSSRPENRFEIESVVEYDGTGRIESYSHTLSWNGGGSSMTTETYSYSGDIITSQMEILDSNGKKTSKNGKSYRIYNSGIAREIQ